MDIFQTSMNDYCHFSPSQLDPYVLPNVHGSKEQTEAAIYAASAPLNLDGVGFEGGGAAFPFAAVPHEQPFHLARASPLNIYQ